MQITVVSQHVPKNYRAGLLLGKAFGLGDVALTADFEIARASAQGTPLAHAEAAASKTIRFRARTMYSA